jgi:hypothetical protein
MLLAGFYSERATINCEAHTQGFCIVIWPYFQINSVSFLLLKIPAMYCFYAMIMDIVLHT